MIGRLISYLLYGRGNIHVLGDIYFDYKKPTEDSSAFMKDNFFMPFDRREVVCHKNVFIYEAKHTNVKRLFKRKIASVREDYIVKYCKLTSLKNSPTYVGMDYNVSHNELTSLEGCPFNINGDVNFSNNMLTSMKYSPGRAQHAYYDNNRITSLDHAPSNLIELSIDGNPIESFVGIHKRFHSLEVLSMTNVHLTKGGLGILLIPGIKKVRVGRYYDRMCSRHLEIDCPPPGSYPLWDKEVAETQTPEFRTYRFLNIIDKYIGQGKAGLLTCQNELLDAGLDEFVQL